MDEPDLDHRHRDKNGEISRKHGNTKITTLRKIYGPHFANGLDDETTLTEALDHLDYNSLHQIIERHEDGALEAEIRNAEK